MFKLAETKALAISEASPVIHQIALLNLRINDMITQLNIALKLLMDENNALKKEIADLKNKQ